MGGQLEAVHASRAEELPELVSEQRVAIVDEVALAPEEPIDVVGEVAGDLLHPENEVADQATEREHLDGEEVRRRDRAQMGLQEGGPRHPTAAQGRGFETVLDKDALDVLRARTCPRLPRTSRIRV